MADAALEEFFPCLFLARTSFLMVWPSCAWTCSAMASMSAALRPRDCTWPLDYGSNVDSLDDGGDVARREGPPTVPVRELTMSRSSETRFCSAVNLFSIVRRYMITEI
ncbi:hypothetical protein C8R44DRAFT_809278 [Mycena epipterygia]|nr:hypothetical protein C8R44DRAFT_809278 [Mycena epipterygia]